MGIRRTLVVMALVLLLPLFGEAIENAVHYVLHGHAAHAEATPDHHAPPAPEHGCTGTFHLCSCCASWSDVAAGVAALDGSGAERISIAASMIRPAPVDLATLERPPRS
jgi:hypothetical protein